MRRVISTVLMAAITGLLAASPAAAEPRSVTAPYVAGWYQLRGDSSVGLHGPDGQEASLTSQCNNVPAPCFFVNEGDASVTIDIDDITFDAVGGTYEFQVFGGRSVGSGHFCDRAEVSVPEGAESLVVMVDNPNDVPGCAGGAVGTAGTVTTTFR